MSVAVSPPPRVSVDGRFFRLGAKKFYVKGLAYGPFAPNAAGRLFASPEQTAADFAQIRLLGANLIRVYNVPDKWFLDLAAEHELKVLVDVPWNKELCFLDSPVHCDEVREAVRRAVYGCSRHPAVFALSVANELPADIVRWSGARAASDFIDSLIFEAKRLDPDCLCTFTNYPPTEFLNPQSVDFVSFNVYLHQETAFKNYLARLQLLADAKPFLLGEIGIDSLREGEARKSEMLRWQIEGAFRGGLTGAVVFSYTDDWWHAGKAVDDWQMGLTTRERTPKDSFVAVQAAFRAGPHFPLPRRPKVSVVVASYNGARTLKACLESLLALNYPDYEVILVDDGSTDTTAEIAAGMPKVRYLRHERNLGLSAARNTGIAAAGGEIIAFTDSDCRVDEDWLYYLVGDMLASEYVGMGGPNLLPPEDSAVAAAVMVSPGGPAHVMLTDRQAEHIPGCNMAFYRSALVELGGFDPLFRQAGDDVDICWRLQQAGYKIGFSPAAFVWHYRRSTVADYLKQQQGYGEAEALLVRKHPEYFNSFGGSIWRGRIYTASKFGILLRRPIIYRGFFGSAGFQSLYVSEPAPLLMLCTSLEYHVLVTAPLWIISGVFHALLPVAITSLLISVGVCVAAGMQAAVPKAKRRAWSRGLVALLFFLQPITRGWARYRGRLMQRPNATAVQQNLDSVALRDSRQSLEEIEYWSGEPVDRLAFVDAFLRQLDQRGWPNRSDIGWSEYDVEIYGSRWSHVQFTTVTETHGRNRHLLRCRLKTHWSLLAKAVFWALGALGLLLIGALGTQFHWPWVWLLTLPLLAWLLHRDQRNLRSMVIVLTDALATGRALTKVQPFPAGDEASANATGTSSSPAPGPTPAAPAPNAVGKAPVSNSI